MGKRTWVREEWRVLSSKFVQQHGLPHGSKVILLHEGSGRQARSDRFFKHRRFKGRAPDDCTVAGLIDGYLRPKLSVELRQRGLEPKLVGPSGERSAGNKKLKTVRRWLPRQTAAEVEAHELREALIEEIESEADSDMSSAEEGRDAELVCSGYVRALVRRFGRAGVEAELESLPPVSFL